MQFISVKLNDRFGTEVLVAINKISAICVSDECILELDNGRSIQTKETKADMLSKIEDARKLDLKNVFSK